MLSVRYSTKFKKDYKRCTKRNLDLSLLQQTIDVLRIPEKLSEEYKNHLLYGDYEGYYECHVQPDWLLVYKYIGNELLLARTGTHSDIFNM